MSYDVCERCERQSGSVEIRDESDKALCVVCWDYMVREGLAELE